jgi:peptidoglycan/LPS O-acetylase OafA/YrhL
MMKLQSIPAARTMISEALKTQDTNSCGSAAGSDCPQPKVAHGKKEIRPLTSLRFFAAFAVVVSHASESFSCWHGLSKSYVVAQAVTFFFVLSGFILTYNYFNLSGWKATLRFYLARVARIWPAHLTTLVLLLVLLPEVFKLKSGDAPLFLCNLFLLQSWVPSWHVFFSYNASSWSISTELFFYLCFPLLLFALRKNWIFPLSITGVVLAIMIGICNSLRLTEFDATRLSSQGLLYISPLSSVFNFAAGMTAAYLWKEHLTQKKLNVVLATVLELFLVGAVCFLNVKSEALRYLFAPALGDAAAYWMQNSGPAVIGFAALITLFAMERGYVSKFLSHPFLVLLGELSFGIYMLHGVLITYLGVNFPLAQSTAACCSFVLGLVVAAHIMFEFIEKPMRNGILNSSSVLFANKSNSVTSSSSKGSRPKSTWTSKRALLFLAELLAFSGFVYFSLPTVHFVNAAEAKKLALKAPVHSVVLAPYLECLGADARVNLGADARGKLDADARGKLDVDARGKLDADARGKLEASAIEGRAEDVKVRNGDGVSLGEGAIVSQNCEISISLIWKSLKSQTLNYTINAVLLDAQSHRLGSLSYMQDGRRQAIDAGKCWIEVPVITQDSPGIPAAISITVLRNKHEVLHTSAAQNVPYSFIVSLSSANRPN